MAVKNLHVHRFTWSERTGMNLMSAFSCQEEGTRTFYGLRHLCQEPGNASQAHPGRKGHICP